jgi:hypothetical protein
MCDESVIAFGCLRREDVRESERVYVCGCACPVRWCDDVCACRS